MDDPKWVSLAQAADLAKCTTEAMRQRIERGTVTARKIKGRWEIDPSTLARKKGGRPRKDRN